MSILSLRSWNSRWQSWLCSLTYFLKPVTTSVEYPWVKQCVVWGQMNLSCLQTSNYHDPGTLLQRKKPRWSPWPSNWYWHAHIQSYITRMSTRSYFDMCFPMTSVKKMTKMIIRVHTQCVSHGKYKSHRKADLGSWHLWRKNLSKLFAWFKGLT